MIFKKNLSIPIFLPVQLNLPIRLTTVGLNQEPSGSIRADYIYNVIKLISEPARLIRFLKLWSEE